MPTDHSTSTSLTVVEDWKPIPGWEQHYEVSDLGRIRRLSTVKRYHEGRFNTPSKGKRGYLRVSLSDSGRKVDRWVHRLVMLAFVGESELHVNHKNCNIEDNRLVNLEYVTPIENVRHAIANGRWESKTGINNAVAKLNDDKVRYIRSMRGLARCKDLAVKFGVCPMLISRVQRRLVWRHVLDLPNVAVTD